MKSISGQPLHCRYSDRNHDFAVQTALEKAVKKGSPLYDKIPHRPLTVGLAQEAGCFPSPIYQLSSASTYPLSTILPSHQDLTGPQP